ncbi:MAG: hypothetical protein J1E96_06175 [Ruminococcus sp.]|nr:hypothetical protein [Ruminococcus sp.]
MNDILKTFFRKPIVAVTSIMIFLTAIVRFVFSFSGFFRVEVPEEYFTDETQVNIINELLKYNINIFELFLAIALLIFFIKSRSKNGNLAFVSSFFRTGSIIGLVLISVASVLCTAFVLLLVLAILLSLSIVLLRFFPIAILSAGVISVLVTIVLILLALFILLAVSQLLFAGSVRKAARGEKIRRGTSMFFAVVNFTLAAVLMLLALSLLIIGRGEQAVPLIAYLLLNILPYTFAGVTALNYFINIKSTP